MEESPYPQGDISKDTKFSNNVEEDTVNIQKQEYDRLYELLSKTEEEVITLQQTINSKVLLIHDLKCKLGITLNCEINAIKNADTFDQLTIDVKYVNENNSNSSVTSTNISQNIAMLSTSNSFRSVEDKVETSRPPTKKHKLKFSAGDKIFAKVKGFVYWPARINPIPQDVIVPLNKIPIFFYGTHEVFFISPKSCWPFDDKNKAKWGKPHPRSYFNQGMDEIENNPTILQYGVDPKAEEYLAQFYQFKRSKINITNEGEIKLDENQDNFDNSKPKNDYVSSSTACTKENGKLVNLEFNENFKKMIIEIEKTNEIVETINEDIIGEIKSQEINNSIENKEMEVTKMKENESNYIFKKKQINDEKENNEIEKKCKEENNTKDVEVVSKLRTRTKSSSTTESVKNKKRTKKSHNFKPNSPDNSNDKDFTPFQKGATISKKNISKAPKSSIKTLPTKTSQKRIKKISKSLTIRRNLSKAKVDLDSLSSISSFDDLKENVTKTHKEELSVEVSRRLRQKSLSKSNTSEMIIEHLNSNTLVPVLCDNGSEMKSSFIGKEVIVQISITDIGKADTANYETKTNENSITSPQISDAHLNTSKSCSHTLIEDIDKSLIDNKPQNNNGAVDGKHIDNIDLEKETSPVLKDADKILKHNKQTNKGRLSSKKSSRKRSRLNTDESDDAIIVRNKKSRVLKSIDSDCEITMCEDKHTNKTLISTNDDNKNNFSLNETSPDIIKRLQSFNSDIRSSLVLGHEDYEKCLGTFKGLCTIDLDLLSLVSVWQLMDTVKKCRRYKRNETVKIEAQNVYKRFLEIYSDSSVDERQKAQVMLSQCRNSQNGLKTVNGDNNFASMPDSIADMFHNKQTNHVDSNKVSILSIDLCESPNTQKEMLEAEKMRMLSADLEAKVSDILNKIEKNSTLNSINRKSLTHLLPQENHDSAKLDLPIEWESVNDVGIRSHERNHIHLSDNDVDDSDDEDDVDAIVKRIENIPIKMVEGFDQQDDISTSTSALDWRIENFFNSSNFANTSNNHYSTKTHTNASKKHRPSKSQSHRSSVRHSHSPMRHIIEDKTDKIPQEIKRSVISADFKGTLEEGEILESEIIAISKSVDNDIYDLLGV